MNEIQTPGAAVRPTKKQKELLGFIERFINEHGYSPSYREIMNGLQYTSVATVSLHVNSLIKRGHLRKRDYSARSLEVVTSTVDTPKITSNQVQPTEEKWLVQQIEHRVAQLEQAADTELRTELEDVMVLMAALQVLGLDEAATSFSARLSDIKKRVPAE